MRIVFDPAKDATNIAKHGISLARAEDLEILAFLVDDRHDYGEARFRAFGLIDGVAHCLVYAVREGHIRAISLRRAHSKEMRRHVTRSDYR
ncbi:BrnT family toxin [Aureimonas glaciei]|uniref:BrnT family toxin n=1 Tax=Aureimonas glaciei TaxID=1776957 RepID=A0A916Y6Z8_9HYPH|nr:BrnT family toxin [Aureimonas glaciei]GGD32683.1 hypothetical protein GCM10011335_39580 [Aureimonas glaciei]